MMKLFGID